MTNHEEKEKKPIYKKVWFWIVIVFFIFWSIGMSKKVDTNNQTSLGAQESNVEINHDVSKVIYEDNDFLVKITNYEYSKITNSIKVNMYIENNSDKFIPVTPKDITTNGNHIDFIDSKIYNNYGWL